MTNERFLVLGFTESVAWQGIVLSRHDDPAQARRAADRWLDSQTDAAIAIAGLEPKDEAIDWRAVGWTPLDIEEVIGQTVEHHRTTAPGFATGSQPGVC